jgi:hypothetical protein
MRLVAGRQKRGRRLRAGIVDTQAYPHGGILWENHVAPAREEVCIDRHSRAVRTHGVAKGTGLHQSTEHRTDQLVAANATGDSATRRADGVRRLRIGIAPNRQARQSDRHGRRGRLLSGLREQRGRQQGRQRHDKSQAHTIAPPKGGVAPTTLDTSSCVSSPHEDATEPKPDSELDLIFRRRRLEPRCICLVWLGGQLLIARVVRYSWCTALSAK